MTFAIGSLASLIFPQTIPDKAAATALILSLSLTHYASHKPGCPIFAAVSSRLRWASAKPTLPPNRPQHKRSPQPHTTSPHQHPPQRSNRRPQLPGAVVLIGHNNKVSSSTPTEAASWPESPASTANPPPPEPMTLDTIFDMASLTKCLVTATAIMQLYEAGKLQFDDPVAKYLPEFAANGKQAVTIRRSHPLLRSARRRLPQRPLGPRRTRQGRRHPPRMNATLYGPPG